MGVAYVGHKSRVRDLSPFFLRRRVRNRTKNHHAFAKPEESTKEVQKPLKKRQTEETEDPRVFKVPKVINDVEVIVEGLVDQLPLEAPESATEKTSQKRWISLDSSKFPSDIKYDERHGFDWTDIGGSVEEMQKYAEYAGEGWVNR